MRLPDDQSSFLGRLRAALARPTLLQRFAVASLLAFLVLGFLLSYALGQSIQSAALKDARQAAYDNLHGRLNRTVGSYDFSGPLTRSQWAAFQSAIANGVRSGRTVQVKLWRRDGTTIYSTDPRTVGKRFPIDDELGKALGGTVASDVSNLTEVENRDLHKKFGKLLEVYIPVIRHGRTLGAFEVYQLYTPVAAEISNLQHDMYGLLAAGLLLLYVLLFGVVRRGSTTITQQQKQVLKYTTDLEQSYNETIGSLAAAVDARDSNTERHAERVTELAVALGQWIGMGDEELRNLERGALLHDVGKIGVSDLILSKPGKLTDVEWDQMRQHPIIGHEMLQNVSFLQAALPVVRHHHERWDGSGYPDRLRGEWIPKAARLFAVIDVYDALTSDRPYRPAMSHQEAILILRKDSGTHFDPAMVIAFEELIEEQGRMQDAVRALMGIRPVAGEDASVSASA
jgi:putative nucleotidyltransferase with HDIG domain